MSVFFLSFVASSTWIALVLSCVFGALQTWIAGSSLLLGAGVAWRLRETKIPALRFSKIEILVALALAIFVYQQFLYLMPIAGAKMGVGNANNLGDLPMHLNLIRSLARGLHFWPENLEWSGEKLRYPFAMDLWNALWENLGLRTSAHLFVTGIFSTLVLFLELRLWGGIFLVLFFFLIAGLSFDQSQIDLKNIFLSVWITQRGFLWALPAGIYLLRNFKIIDQQSLKQKILFGFFWSSLVFFHLHSFALLSLYLGLVWILQKQWHLIRNFCLPVGLFGILWLVFLFSSGSPLQNSLGWSLAWTWNPNGTISVGEHLFRNWALFIPIFLFQLGRAILKKSFVEALPLVLLVFFLNFKVAPWAWDNIKVLLWLMLIVSQSFSSLVFEKRRPWISVLVASVLFFPGGVQLWKAVPGRAAVVYFDHSRFELECVNPNFDVNEALVFEPDYAHPLLFWGAKSVYGYEGHLWSHGYSIGARKDLVTPLLKAPFPFGFEWRPAAKNLGAKWLYSSESEDRLNGELARKPACLSKPQQGGNIYDFNSESRSR